MLALRIVLLALGAAVFPALLACVAILISRPEPRRLLLAFYLGGLGISLASGVIVLKAFGRGEGFAGNSGGSPGPAVSIVAGAVGLFFAWLLASRRGHALIDAWHSRHPRSRREPGEREGPSWVERRLDRASVGVAFLVGAVINLPGPFYLLALGEIADGSYPAGEELALILLFNVVMFLMLEVPLVAYLLSPETTAGRVAAFSAWLDANGLRVVGALVAVFSLGLLAQGVGAAL